MGLISTEATVKLCSKTVKYYEDKGYKIPQKLSARDGKSLVTDYSIPITVRIEDLTMGSKSKVLVYCDLCKKQKEITYLEYNRSCKKEGYYACNDCKQIKERQIIKNKYGVDSVTQLEGTKEKARQTNIRKYGYEYPTQAPEIKEKITNSILERYGETSALKNEEVKKKSKNVIREKYHVDHVMELPEVRERIRKTCLERFGCEYPSQNPEVKAKIRETCLKNYGVANSFLSPIVQEKKRQTFYKNGTTITSKQQKHIFDLYAIYNSNISLNYPIKYYNADICFPEENLCLEYDGSGHDLGVKFGALTQEEFNQKEIIRNSVIKREGYKQIRLISSTDKLPSDEVLLQILEISKKYFSDFPEHSWINFDIDTSTVRNAEQKDGVFFDYGDLRRIA